MLGTGISFGNTRIYSSNGASQAQNAAIRPVVYLKSDVAISYDETTGIYTIE